MLLFVLFVLLLLLLWLSWLLRLLRLSLLLLAAWKSCLVDGIPSLYHLLKFERCQTLYHTDQPQKALLSSFPKRYVPYERL